jgi:hypothetical protein
MYLLSSEARNKHYSLGDLIGRTEPAEGNAVGAVVTSRQLAGAACARLATASTAVYPRGMEPSANGPLGDLSFRAVEQRKAPSLRPMV